MFIDSVVIRYFENYFVLEIITENWPGSSLEARSLDMVMSMHAKDTIRSVLYKGIVKMHVPFSYDKDIRRVWLIGLAYKVYFSKHIWTPCISLKCLQENYLHYFKNWKVESMNQFCTCQQLAETRRLWERYQWTFRDGAWGIWN